MSDCLEVLFVSDNSGRLQTATCYNPHIGTTLMTYKGGCGATKKCLSVVGNDYIISANTTKPLLHVWPLNKQEPLHELQMVLPGKPTALTVSPDGHYCVVGIDGKIYVWQISSGVLLNVISRHFQNINKIVFVDDSSHFITAGEDGLVLVWKLAEVVTKQFGDMYKITTSQVQPVYNFSQHSLPVTDIYVGHGKSKARLFTVSADQTCKIFCLASGTLLLSIIYDHVLTCVTVNELETELFVGTSGGIIQVFSLEPYPRTLEHHVSEESSAFTTFNGHSKAITCLSVSVSGTTLASGSDDEKVFLWNIQSRQLIRSFEMKGPISNMFFYFSPSNIFSNTFEPHLVVKKFEKVNSMQERNLELNVWVNEDLQPISFMSKFKKNEEIEHTCERNEESEDVGGLKQQIIKLKDVNKQLYQFAMNKILKNPLTIGVNGANEISD